MPEEDKEIKYVVPELYFPKPPLITFGWCEKEQHVFLSETDLNLLLDYIKQTEEAVCSLYNYDEIHPD